MMDASTLHPLRQRMIDDMTLRGFGVTTQRGYIAAVRRCTTHMRKPPGALLAEDARAFLLHLQANGASVSSVNQHSVALRFFLRVTLGRTEHLERIPVLREAKRLPMVLTPEEVARRTRRPSRTRLRKARSTCPRRPNQRIRVAGTHPRPPCGQSIPRSWFAMSSVEA